MTKKDPVKRHIVALLIMLTLMGVLGMCGGAAFLLIHFGFIKGLITIMSCVGFAYASSYAVAEDMA